MSELVSPYRTIELTQGQVALVSAEDYEELSRYKWRANFIPHAKTFYAVRHPAMVNGLRGKLIFMHRQIAGEPIDKYVDHRNGNTLDNRRENLRVATPAQNVRNQRLSRTNKAGFKGVYRRKNSKLWYAGISVNYKKIYLGQHSTKEEAAAAYRAASARYHGEFGRAA